MKREIMVAGLALVSIGTAHAGSWSPDGKQIVFSYIGGPENIYIVNADGSNLRELVVRDQRDFQPEWAPDGSHIVFTTVEDGVHVMMRVNPDGTGLEKVSDVSEAAGDPDYSPDGSTLLYFTDEPVERNLYVRDVKTGATTQLSDTTDFDEMTARWTPDGAGIVFVGSTKEPDAESDIWFLDVKTGDRRNLTNSPSNGEFHADISNAGDKIVYIRVKDGAFDVATRDLANGEEKIVASGNGYAVLSPHFSPDDKQIAFTRTDFAEKGSGMPSIAVVTLATGAEKCIAKGLYLSEMNPE